jgi:hypothetical protein
MKESLTTGVGDSRMAIARHARTNVQKMTNYIRAASKKSTVD